MKLTTFVLRSLKEPMLSCFLYNLVKHFSLILHSSDVAASNSWPINSSTSTILFLIYRQIFVSTLSCLRFSLHSWIFNIFTFSSVSAVYIGIQDLSMSAVTFDIILSHDVSSANSNNRSETLTYAAIERIDLS